MLPEEIRAFVRQIEMSLLDAHPLTIFMKELFDIIKVKDKSADVPLQYLRVHIEKKLVLCVEEGKFRLQNP